MERAGDGEKKWEEKQQKKASKGEKISPGSVTEIDTDPNKRQ